MKTALIYASLATLFSIYAHALTVSNWEPVTVGVYLKTDEENIHLFEAKAHEPTKQSILAELGDFIETVPKGDKTYVQFMLKANDQEYECGEAFLMEHITDKQKLAKSLNTINNESLDTRKCIVRSKSKTKKAH